MKASRFLQAWTERLKSQGVKFEFDHELTGFTQEHGSPTLFFSEGQSLRFDAVLLALGGGSWEPTETPLRWPAFIKKQGIGFTEFASSNVGYQVKWPIKFLQEAEGKPLKSIEATSKKGARRGDAMITNYGIEGNSHLLRGRKRPNHGRSQTRPQCRTNLRQAEEGERKPLADSKSEKSNFRFATPLSLSCFTARPGKF